ncbi:MAG: hypothetical protein ACOC1K_04165 [Nanoarchaeota archaeon]
MGIQIVAESDTVSKPELYNQIMFEVQKKMIEIENNREEKKSIIDEVAEMHAYISKLCEVENVDDSIIVKKKQLVDDVLK